MPMDIRVRPTALAGVVLIEPECFSDERGFFMESYSQRTFAAHGLDAGFVQDNHSRSARGVLRGLHYQGAEAPQVRLVRCTAGTILDVAVDIRLGSPTFGRFVAEVLSAENRRQLLMDPGFAHGFRVLSECAEVQYKCSNFHTKAAERTLAWNDPELAIPWGDEPPTLSARDQSGESLDAYRRGPAFVYDDADGTILRASRRLVGQHAPGSGVEAGQP